MALFRVCRFACFCFPLLCGGLGATCYGFDVMSHDVWFGCDGNDDAYDEDKLEVGGRAVSLRLRKRSAAETLVYLNL